MEKVNFYSNNISFWTHYKFRTNNQLVAIWKVDADITSLKRQQSLSDLLPL